jgi:hypothetical protein
MIRLGLELWGGLVCVIVPLAIVAVVIAWAWRKSRGGK